MRNRSGIVVALLALSGAGCAHAWIKSEPAGARLSVGGKLVGTGHATVSTPKGQIVVVRADHEGFRPACAVVEYRRDTTIALTRAEPNDPPLPSDTEIERAWVADHTNLCAKRAENHGPDVVVTAGDLSRPYEILGDVQVDTTEKDNSGAVATDALLRGPLLSTIRPTMKGDTSEMLGALRDVAIARFGARVDAVINATVFTQGRDYFARGVAVHFVEHAAAPAARTITERLDELDKLGASGAITPAEYRERRKAILSDL